MAGSTTTAGGGVMLAGVFGSGSTASGSTGGNVWAGVSCGGGVGMRSVRSGSRLRRINSVADRSARTSRGSGFEPMVVVAEFLIGDDVQLVEVPVTSSPDIPRFAGGALINDVAG